jgi:hypothetical protein
MSAQMSSATAELVEVQDQPNMIELHCQDRQGRVRVVLPDKHVMVMTVETAAQACGAFKNLILFGDQFKMLLDTLAKWLKDRIDAVKCAYLTIRDANLLFVVVLQNGSYDGEMEDQFTDLDLEIANDSAYDLINLDVLGLPSCSEEAHASFLAVGKTIRFRMNGD